jgi:methyltransferase (TIGR00027 family)
VPRKVGVVKLNEGHTMQPSTASRTALITSLMRALHTRFDPHRIIDDPWGDRLVPGLARKAIQQKFVEATGADPDAIADADKDTFVAEWLRRSAVYAGVITRSRYAEDALHSAVAKGLGQYVLVGAGFDSYALRIPPAAAHINVYEVDHPATQLLKRERLRECSVSVPQSLHFLAADLAAESLHAVLGASSFESTKPAFFSWLGVTMYLTRAANFAALRSIARSAARGSELVLSYVDQRAFDTDEIRNSELGKRLAAAGEPFLSGFNPNTLAGDLQELGFEVLEDLDDFQVVERYDPRGLNGLNPERYSRIAHVHLTGLA